MRPNEGAFAQQAGEPGCRGLVTLNYRDPASHADVERPEPTGADAIVFAGLDAAAAMRLESCEMSRPLCSTMGYDPSGGDLSNRSKGKGAPLVQGVCRAPLDQLARAMGRINAATATASVTVTTGSPHGRFPPEERTYRTRVEDRRDYDPPVAARRCPRRSLVVPEVAHRERPWRAQDNHAASINDERDRRRGTRPRG